MPGKINLKKQTVVSLGGAVSGVMNGGTYPNGVASGGLPFCKSFELKNTDCAPKKIKIDPTNTGDNDVYKPI
jgi:hypothetical protein